MKKKDLGFYLRLLIAGLLILFSIIAHQKADASEYNRSEWQPSNIEYHCEWAARQATVLEKYKKHGLSYAPADLFWMKSKLLGCL
jgi:hypothetical protein